MWKAVLFFMIPGDGWGGVGDVLLGSVLDTRATLGYTEDAKALNSNGNPP